jgi:hypothetical protein
MDERVKDFLIDYYNICREHNMCIGSYEDIQVVAITNPLSRIRVPDNAYLTHSEHHRPESDDDFKREATALRDNLLSENVQRERARMQAEFNRMHGLDDGSHEG